MAKPERVWVDIHGDRIPELSFVACLSDTGSVITRGLFVKGRVQKKNFLYVPSLFIEHLVVLDPSRLSKNNFLDYRMLMYEISEHWANVAAHKTQLKKKRIRWKNDYIPGQLYSTREHGLLLYAGRGEHKNKQGLMKCNRHIWIPMWKADTDHRVLLANSTLDDGNALDFLSSYKKMPGTHRIIRTFHYKPVTRQSMIVYGARARVSRSVLTEVHVMLRQKHKTYMYQLPPKRTKENASN